MPSEIKTYVRSTSHSLKFGNQGKQDLILRFIPEYEKAVKFYVDYIWDSVIEYETKKGTVTWNRKNDLLQCPAMISTTDIVFESPLTARALKCAATQACGIVRSVTKKRIKDIALFQYCLQNNKPISKKLTKRLSNDMTKPDCNHINCELNSICLNLTNIKKNQFDLWIDFSALFKSNRGETITFPFKHTRMSNKWIEKGNIMTSFLLNRNQICIRFEVDIPIHKTTGISVGVDQGVTTCVTLTDGQDSAKNPHKHDLDSILNKMAKQESGSKRFRKSVAHRTNYINWSIHTINFDNIAKINFERITNIQYGKHVSPKLKHFTNVDIRDSMKSTCIEKGVLFSEVDNHGNSIRCNECGWTQKKNRKGKIFSCCKCNHTEDADRNAAFNVNERDQLPKLPFEFMTNRLHIKGFYWTIYGLFFESGEEITVPHPNK